MSQNTPQLIALQEQHLELVRAWRNHDDIRPLMLSQHTIDADEHRAWFDKLATQPQRKAYVYTDSSGPAGFVQFDGLMPQSTATWGFYKAPNAPKGTGYTMLTLALQALFNEYKVHKVAAQVLGSNIASLGLHSKLGFRQEGTLRAHVLLGGAWHDVVCFGLLDTEYATWK
ncbi:MAG TPA: UDP-4-amino-4,6-dideoxy-N-acetyl-beta-L-altrosamine N-acetyltransferase [Limnobacter sp.]|nr:UDP-4-amino-4,6-dideoxy-N-acetyl-beta-L-altrosamine N-acetyltransferase [Limnobacter sp.]